MNQQMASVVDALKRDIAVLERIYAEAPVETVRLVRGSDAWHVPIDMLYRIFYIRRCEGHRVVSEEGWEVDDPVFEHVDCGHISSAYLKEKSGRYIITIKDCKRYEARSTEYNAFCH